MVLGKHKRKIIKRMVILVGYKNKEKKLKEEKKKEKTNEGREADVPLGCVSEYRGDIQNKSCM